MEACRSTPSWSVDDSFDVGRPAVLVKGRFERLVQQLLVIILLALTCEECYTTRDRVNLFRRDPVQFRPLQDRVLVRRIEEEEKTKGGIIIPDTAKEKPMEGEILAAGPGARGDDGKLHPLDVKVGDRVLFGKWSGTEIKIEGEDLVVMKESDIMGVVEKS